MRVTFLGTGTSQGIPIIGCKCAICTSADKRDNRLRASVLIQTPEVTLVIDTGPDFRYQMLRAKVDNLDAVVFTHGHKDHVAGMDDIRAFNYILGRKMDIYATAETQQVLKREFEYAFKEHSYPGIPQIDLHTITNAPFYIKGLEITPIRVLHYKMEVLGYRIGNFTYITDANYIAPEEMEKINGSRVMVLNALRHEQHISHYSLAEAIEVVRAAGVETAYFTHISHQLGLHADVENTLPAGMHLACDGLQLDL